MSNRIQPRSSSFNPPSLVNENEGSSSRANSTVPTFVYPRLFFGHPMEHLTIVECSQDEIEALQNSSSEGTASPSRRMRALAGRAQAHQILANDFQSLFQVPAAMQFENQENENISAMEPESPFSSATSLTTTSPASITASPFEIEKRKELLLAKAKKNHEQADRYLREAKYTMRLAKTIREAGNSEEAAKLEKKIEKQNEDASYHTLCAREFENLAYGNTTSSPGAYHVRPEGKYQDEYAVTSSAQSTSAQKVSFGKNKLSSMQIAKATPIPEADSAKGPRRAAQSPDKLHQASEISVQKVETEVEAEPLRELNLSVAQARKKDD